MEIFTIQTMVNCFTFLQQKAPKHSFSFSCSISHRKNATNISERESHHFVIGSNFSILLKLFQQLVYTGGIHLTCLMDRCCDGHFYFHQYIYNTQAITAHVSLVVYKHNREPKHIFTPQVFLESSYNLGIYFTQLIQFHHKTTNTDLHQWFPTFFVFDIDPQPCQILNQPFIVSLRQIGVPLWSVGHILLFQQVSSSPTTRVAECFHNLLITFSFNLLSCN